MERTRRTDDGTYPNVEEELAKVEERATARAIPVAKDASDASEATRVNWRSIEGSPGVWLVESLAEGFFCRAGGCGVWNGDLKEVRATCRACGSPRPRPGAEGPAT